MNKCWNLRENYSSQSFSEFYNSPEVRGPSAAKPKQVEPPEPAKGFGWYDKGGPLQPGWTLAYNGTGKTEHVQTAEQASSLGGDIVIHNHITLDGKEIATSTQRYARQYNRKNGISGTSNKWAAAA